MEMYYLNSRYYLPIYHRFLNADALAQTGQGILDKNMFAYCGNNPVNRLDANGNSWRDVKNWFSEKYNALKKLIRSAISDIDEISRQVVCEEEHKKRGTTNPANKNKHQNGQARKNRDKGKEKGDARRKPNPNKRRPPQIDIPSIDIPVVKFNEDALYAVDIAILVVIGGAMLYIIANDVTGVGVADDVALVALVPVAWERTEILFENNEEDA